MIQIMCDKTYNYKRNPQINQKNVTHSSDDDNSDRDNTKTTQNQHSKKTKKRDNVPVNNLSSKDFSQSEPFSFTNTQPQSFVIDPNNSIFFNNKTETLNLPPSFNLRSNQKSTPNRNVLLSNVQSLTGQSVPVQKLPLPGSQTFANQPRQVTFSTSMLPGSQSLPNQILADIHQDQNQNEDAILTIEENDETLV